jgi:hypothetical protein
MAMDVQESKSEQMIDLLSSTVKTTKHREKQTE